MRKVLITKIWKEGKRVNVSFIRVDGSREIFSFVSDTNDQRKYQQEAYQHIAAINRTTVANVKYAPGGNVQEKLF